MFLVPVIFKCGYYAENKSSILDYHLQPLAKKVESYIQDTNYFLKNIKKLGKLPKNATLWTIDAAGLYPSTPPEQDLALIRKKLNNRENRKVTTDSSAELADTILKNNYLRFLDKIFKQKRGTSIETKPTPS